MNQLRVDLTQLTEEEITALRNALQKEIDDNATLSKEERDILQENIDILDFTTVNSINSARTELTEALNNTDIKQTNALNTAVTNINTAMDNVYTTLSTDLAEKYAALVQDLADTRALTAEQLAALKTTLTERIDTEANQSLLRKSRYGKTMRFTHIFSLCVLPICYTNTRVQIEFVKGAFLSHGKYATPHLLKTAE